MKRVLLAAVAIVGLSLSAGTALADHGYRGGGHGHHHGGGGGHYHTGYYGGGHYHGHVHYGRAYPYGYYSSPVTVYRAYDPYCYDDYYYPRQSFSYYGPGISFSIGR
jgi:hypothetical protein